jgi:hypothetical protein
MNAMNSERSRRRVVNQVAKELSNQAFYAHRDKLLAELADEQESGRDRQLIERWLRFLASPHSTRL